MSHVRCIQDKYAYPLYAMDENMYSKLIRQIGVLTQWLSGLDPCSEGVGQGRARECVQFSQFLFFFLVEVETFQVLGYFLHEALD